MPQKSKCIFDWRTGNPGSAHTGCWSSDRFTVFKTADITGISPSPCYRAKKPSWTSSFLLQIYFRTPKRNLIYLWVKFINCCSIRFMIATYITLTHKFSPMAHNLSWWVLLLLLWFQWPAMISHILARICPKEQNWLSTTRTTSEVLCGSWRLPRCKAQILGLTANKECKSILLKYTAKTCFHICCYPLCAMKRF